MIKKIRVQNFHGIKNIELDFSVDESNANDCTFVRYGDFIKLFPTFLGSGSSGKTSLVRAIAFVKLFLWDDSFKRFISKYVYGYLKRSYYGMTEGMYYSGKIAPVNEWEGIMLKKIGDINDFKKWFSTILDDNVIDNENFFEIEIEDQENRKILVHVGKDNFVVKLFGVKIDVIEICWRIINRFVMLYEWGSDERKFTNILVDKFVSDEYKASINIPRNYFMKIHHFDMKAEVNNMFVEGYRGETEVYLHRIQEFLGDEMTKKILTAIDPNILIKDREILYKKKKTSFSHEYLTRNIQTIMKIFGLSSSVWHLGGTLIIDDVNYKVDSTLLEFIIKLYKNEDVNRFGAQLILTSSDPEFIKYLIKSDNIYVGDDGLNAGPTFREVEINEEINLIDNSIINKKGADIFGEEIVKYRAHIFDDN